jgi:FKBP-type peptidyl-prolyl cis-trans isomerase SlyD
MYRTPPGGQAVIIENGKVVTFQYQLKDADGTVLDSSEESAPLAYLHGAGNIIPGLETVFDGRTAGDEFSAVIEPEDAYGLRDEGLIGQVPRENLQGIDDLQVGMELEARTPEGLRVVQVVAMDDDHVTIDANHPLAGRTLHFHLTVTEVRDATAEELEHGHAHGPDGHGH